MTEEEVLALPIGTVIQFSDAVSLVSFRGRSLTRIKNGKWQWDSGGGQIDHEIIAGASVRAYYRLPEIERTILDQEHASYYTALTNLPPMSGD